MEEFVFMTRGGDRPEAPPGVDPERLACQYSADHWAAWYKYLTENGHIVDPGAPYASSAKIVAPNDQVTDLSFDDVTDIAGGYMVIRAKDISEAIELAKGCPVLRRNGRVEIRPVMRP